MTFERLLHAEVMKLRRTLVVLLLAAVPTMIFILLTGLRVSGRGALNWEMHALTGAGIWASILLPLTTTALTALLAQIEHGPNAWSEVLSLPTPKWRVFAAKALLTVAIMGVIPMLLWLVILASGLVAGMLKPAVALTGALPMAGLAFMLAKMWMASFLVIAIQFAVAMSARRFAVPIIVGIGGTFFAVAATAAKAGVYFPWLLPVNMLAEDPGRAFQAFLLGSVGGVVAITASCVWLGRRDWH